MYAWRRQVFNMLDLANYVYEALGLLNQHILAKSRKCFIFGKFFAAVVAAGAARQYLHNNQGINKQHLVVVPVNRLFADNQSIGVQAEIEAW